MAVSTFSGHAAVNINVLAGPTSSSPLYQTSGSGSLAPGDLIRVGVLNEAAYALLTPSQQLDFAQVNALFTEVATTSINGSGEAFAIGLSGTFTTLADPLYTWVFDDPVATSAGEWGLFHASSSTAAPWLMPADLGTVSLNSTFIDTIAAGSNNGGNFQLEVVPEPSAGLLTLVGLGGLALMRRSRR